MQRLEEESFTPARDQTPVVQSTVRRYTDSYPGSKEITASIIIQ
jgi:hypothetical protein